MIKKITLVNSVLMVAVFATAQTKVFTLQSCIDKALQQNLLVNQRMYQMQNDAVNKAQAQLNLLPGINGNINHYANQGRSIDLSTNTYTTQKNTSANYGVNGEVTLFQGLTLRNIVKQKSLDYEASKMDWQQQKNDIAISVMLAYLQLLNNEDMLVQMNVQASLTEKQIQRLEVLEKKGAVAPSMVYDVQGQYGSDQLAIINAQNNVVATKIELCKLMNIPYEKDMQFEKINSENIPPAYPTTDEMAYQSALQHFSKIQAADFRMQSAAQQLKVAKGFRYPTVKIGSGVGSNFSSTVPNAYFQQLGNNISTYYGVTMAIPIVNGLRAKNDIKRARINWENAAFQSQTVKTTLQQDIALAYSNMMTSFDKYKKLSEQVAAYQKSFQAAEARFNAGLGNTIDYLIIKNNVDKASINLISGKYDYLLRIKVFEYYQGNVQ